MPQTTLQFSFNLECQGDDISRGNICYKKMFRRPWEVARCPEVDGEQTEFVSPETEDENAFIYKHFSEAFKRSLWMNARVCGTGKLCDQAFAKVFYHNFDGAFPTNGCAEMPDGKKGQWVAKSCSAALYYVCKYGKFSIH